MHQLDPHIARIVRRRNITANVVAILMCVVLLGPLAAAALSALL